MFSLYLMARYDFCTSEFILRSFLIIRNSGSITMNKIESLTTATFAKAKRISSLLKNRVGNFIVWKFTRARVWKVSRLIQNKLTWRSLGGLQTAVSRFVF